tara:strand:- start:7143 stop:7337 length:195 start_codon:yes stop_codon:yes gene_type:complete
MTKQSFNEIIKMVRELHIDFPDGIDDEQAFDMARNIINDTEGLKEYINKELGIADAIGYLACEM